jgi:hypothetical protein
MIICYSKNFIFSKPKKVGGSSIHYCLGSVCDINIDKFSIPGNTPNLKRFKTNINSKYNHATPLVIKKVGNISDEKFNSMIKMTIVRNPWDECVSRFYWENKNIKAKDFESMKIKFNNFLLKSPKYKKDLNIEYYIDEKDELICDRYLRFESLSEDYNNFCEEVGIEKIPKLPRLKSQFRQYRGKKYQSYYNEESIEYVKNIYKKRIDIFNYEF